MADKTIIKDGIRLVGADESVTTSDTEIVTMQASPASTVKQPLFTPDMIKHMVYGAVLFMIVSWLIGELDI